MYDLAIVGSGPAGMSCALTAKRRNLNAVVLGQSIKTNLLWNTEHIDNYPGMPMVSGKDMLLMFEKQILDLGIDFKHGLVRQIMPNDDAFMLLQGDQIIEAKAVVICIGVAKPKMINGEETLLGNGVSYCATCDAMFYKNKNIAVLSENEDGVEEANFLSSIVNNIDYYTIRKHDSSALNSNIIKKDNKIIAINKNSNMVVLDFDKGFSAYDGVFIFRSAMKLDNLVFDLETDLNYIKVNRNMETNIAGLFAAGDCTGKPLQIPKSVGEGNIAALSVAKYLESK